MAADEHTSDLGELLFPRAIARTRAEAILTFLDARGVEISEEARAQITGCGDRDQLDTWIRRAATVSNIDDLFV